MPSLIVPAPAKLNLFLHVTGRRADGLHLVETLFVPLDFGDTVEVAVRADGVRRRGWKTKEGLNRRARRTQRSHVRKSLSAPSAPLREIFL